MHSGFFMQNKPNSGSSRPRQLEGWQCRKPARRQLLPQPRYVQILTTDSAQLHPIEGPGGSETNHGIHRHTEKRIRISPAFPWSSRGQLPPVGLSFTHISLLTEVLTVIKLAAIFHNTVHLFEL